jgi:hypothetical protein
MTLERDDPLILDIRGAIGQNAAGRIRLPMQPMTKRRLCQQHFKLT